MQDSDFVRLEKSAAERYIATQPMWKRKSLAEKWRAASATREAAADAAVADGKPYRPHFHYQDAYGSGRAIGLIMTVVGVLVIIGGAVVPASTSSYSGDVVNLHGGIMKLSLLVSGFGLLIAGILMNCLNEIAENLRSANAYRRWLND